MKRLVHLESPLLYIGGKISAQFICTNFLEFCFSHRKYNFVHISFLWWLIAAIEKKLSKSRKNFHNREKTFRIEKKNFESRKIF